jgi:inner membrane protein
MEPVTHLLTGAVLSRVGLNRKAAYMTAAMVLAAELPDVDLLWGIGGPVVGFEHHRGITHTLLAAPVEAAVLTGLFWGWHRWRGATERKAAVSWGWLFGGCWLAVLSHLLLDWTNNYGIRPFFPFDAHWYAGSFVFIFEPVLFGLLLVALVMPPLFGLIGAEVGARTDKFAGRGWAIAVLVGVAALYALRYSEHNKAVELAMENGPAGTTRVFASPHPGNPFLWSTVSDTPELYQMLTVDTRLGVVLPGEPADRLVKPQGSLAILRAKRTFLGRIYLDWSMYPVLQEGPDTEDPNHPLTRVTFTDARFLYDTWLLRRGTRPPLEGSVVLDMAAAEEDRVVETEMDGRVQR